METIKVQITTATKRRPAQLVCRFKKTTHRLPLPQTTLETERRDKAYLFAMTVVKDFTDANPTEHALEVGACMEHTNFYSVYAPYRQRFVFQVLIACFRFPYR